MHFNPCFVLKTKRNTSDCHDYWEFPTNSLTYFLTTLFDAVQNFSLSALKIEVCTYSKTSLMEIVPLALKNGGFFGQLKVRNWHFLKSKIPILKLIYWIKSRPVNVIKGIPIFHLIHLISKVTIRSRNRPISFYKSLGPLHAK